MTRYAEKVKHYIDAVRLPDYRAGEEYSEFPDWLVDSLETDVTYDDEKDEFRVATGGFYDDIARAGDYLVCLGKNAYGWRLRVMDAKTLASAYDEVPE